jgi:predicted acylesterase/phospholipase RssA
MSRSEEVASTVAQPPRRLGLVAAVVLIWVIVALWITAAAVWQVGWRGWLTVLPLMLVLATIVALTMYGYESRRWGLAVFLGPLCLLCLLLWLYAAGTIDAARSGDWATLVWDLAALGIAFVVTVLAFEGLAVRRDKGGRPLKERFSVQWDHFQAIGWFGLAWVLLSLVTCVRSAALPVDSERFARLASTSPTVDVQAQRWNDLRIGVALSGGGYRAAVFHAGTLQALEELGLRVDNLSTVSGGSIIGAYYAVGGDPAAFVRAVGRGRFNLTRQLLSLPNALLLALPARLPGSEVELLPLADFDRLDVQQKLLERALFRDAELSGGLDPGEPQLGQPHLMIATTDLTYGSQLGLLPDGMVKLGAGPAARDVFRGRAFEAERELGLPERVALSGAFPGALPGRVWWIRVDPARATGDGWRRLVLVDGGARDNLGLELLRAADALADEGKTPGLEDHLTPAHWNLDAVLVSDGGAAFGVLDAPGSGLTQLSRTVEVSGIPFDARDLSGDPCQSIFETPPQFSPSLHLMPPDTSFNLERAPARTSVQERHWRLRIDPVRYPEPVLRRLVSLLPDAATRNEATDRLEDFLERWATHRTTGRDWSFSRTRSAAACAQRAEGALETSRGSQPRMLPGVCAALELETILLTSIQSDLEVFFATSTLVDRLPEKTARSLERLGKTLVYLEWPILERRLDTAASCPPNSAESREVVPVGETSM